ncbi:hypothetical protein [Streptomyces gardneri]|uniref:hypothetical protein n=1 Tax=Streptomyces gardneri TaxID=66892 RepID=UPI0035E2020E
MSARDELRDCFLSDSRERFEAAADAHRAEVQAERDAQIVAWLLKKSHEYGKSNRENRAKAEAVWRMADKLSRGAVRPDGAQAELAEQAADEVDQLRARVAELEAAAEKVAGFCAQRAEYVTNLRECSPTNKRDYYRWSGHAEARRQLSQLLGLPVGWPIEDEVLAADIPNQRGGTR